MMTKYEMSRRHLTRMDDVLLFRGSLALAPRPLAISPRATIRQRCICVDYICARVYKDVRARPTTKVFMYFLTKRNHLIHNLLDASFQSLQDDFANVSDTSSTTSRDERLFQHTMQTLKWAAAYIELDDAKTHPELIVAFTNGPTTSLSYSVLGIITLIVY